MELIHIWGVYKYLSMCMCINSSMQFYYMGSLYNHYCNEDIELVNLNNNREWLSLFQLKKDFIAK